MIAQSHPFLLFARLSVGFGVGIASLLFTLPRFGRFGGVTLSVGFGLATAFAATAAIPWLAACFKKSRRPNRQRDILEDFDNI